MSILLGAVAVWMPDNPTPDEERKAMEELRRAEEVFFRTPAGKAYLKEERRLAFQKPIPWPTSEELLYMAAISYCYDPPIDWDNPDPYW